MLLRRPLLSSAARSYATAAEAIKPSTFGQPAWQSHPHLIRPNELTSGIPAQEYESRRKKLMHGLPDNSIVVSVAGTVKYMSGHIFYDFRQASDFWYLTGFEEPDSAVILEKAPSTTKGYHMTLFSTGKNPSKEQWDGARTSFDALCSVFGADDARSIDDFSAHLRSRADRHAHVYVDVPPIRRRGKKPELLSYLTGSSIPTHTDPILDGLRHKPRPLAPQIARLRAFKSPNEQRIMRNAADISGRAHAKTMRFTHPGISEHVLSSHFQYLCLLNGAQRLAYVPVVASGPNALVIHYTKNNQLVKDGEVVLVDAGCELNGYASDITRTFPSSGTFTPPQRDLYTAVLNTQKALINLCTEDSGMSLYDLHARSCRVLREELRQIGFNVGAGEVEKLYPHFLCHPIGIDLHESDNFNRGESIKENMVITIEPGVYVPNDPAYPKAFWGIGVRIEDEVLVGKEYPTVLSVAAPKEIADVEGACQGLLGLEAGPGS
ncbi:peptidase m24 [Moniliophthora roreri MCA 2997]|uniref:Peptidase m24 n=2 Tax=Moniliophthora roreri TaxID=221103 RepID=V2X1V4_MONRO|nr:peptidase m24 [Moniliophthora roreri MCA 2997]KAI3604920.1 peptidase m24 [Moniliophthora roreri]